MHHRRASSAGRNRAAHQEGSLTEVTFVGGFPNADFTVRPSLPEVAMLGRSNVGKSSLLNALVGRKAIARISKTPGKTRECNVYKIDELMYLVDLPGYGWARVGKTERRRLRELIEQYVRGRRTLTGIVWLLDVRRVPSQDDIAIADMLAERKIPILVAITKSDKLTRQRRTQQMRSIVEAVDLSADQAVVTSAVTKEGMDDLRESILALAGDRRSP